ncbi:TPA: DUF4355 domain-containing protein [Streptococcus suis]|nr:DUF4355 domain-containing protein [Streptococcus suis]
MNEVTQTVEVVEDDKQVAAEPEQVTTDPKDEKKYTDADVDAIIDKKFAKWKAEQEKAESEAKKLAKMNAEQKAEYEARKQADYIAELEARINRSGLEKEASKMLAESGLVADDKILGFVVKDTAEATQDAVESFSALVNDLADKKVSEMLKGKTPKKVEQSTSGGITKEQFNRMGYKDRNELLQNDPELYAKLKG